MKTDLLTRIETFNAGRDPERLALKYKAMRKDAFGFLRGTCHLFYEDLPVAELPESPLAWCCGDLHLQNFGTFKGDNRLTYFDLSDFDESCRAPASWDLVRFLTNLLVAGETLKLSPNAAQLGTAAFLDGYAATLASGKARWLERATAQGVIRSLLDRVKKQTRRAFLDERTQISKGQRRLLTGNSKALPMNEAEIAKLRAWLTKLTAKEQDPGFYRLLDAAHRIAGTGSLGLERYVLLVEGRGSPSNNFLLDLKYAPGSCVADALAQPKWASEAERVVAIQQEMQAVPPALLRPVRFGGRSFVLKELMPTNDRLDYTKWRDDPERFTGAIRTMGEITAWAQLRTSSRRGAASADEFIAFGHRKEWRKPLLRVAAASAERTQRQWREFARVKKGIQKANPATQA